MSRSAKKKIRRVVFQVHSVAKISSDATSLKLSKIKGQPSRDLHVNSLSSFMWDYVWMNVCMVQRKFFVKRKSITGGNHMLQSIHVARRFPWECWMWCDVDVRMWVEICMMYVRRWFPLSSSRASSEAAFHSVWTLWSWRSFFRYKIAFCYKGMQLLWCYSSTDAVVLFSLHRHLLVSHRKSSGTQLSLLTQHNTHDTYCSFLPSVGLSLHVPHLPLSLSSLWIRLWLWLTFKVRHEGREKKITSFLFRAKSCTLYFLSHCYADCETYLCVMCVDTVFVLRVPRLLCFKVYYTFLLLSCERLWESMSSQIKSGKNQK